MGLYLLIVDVTCVKSLRSSYGVVSPDSPSRGCQGGWMVLRGVVSPDPPPWQSSRTLWASRVSSSAEFLSSTLWTLGRNSGLRRPRIRGLFQIFNEENLGPKILTNFHPTMDESQKSREKKSENLPSQNVLGRDTWTDKHL